ncbi:MAG: hypothetical protein J2O48_11430, partial [Solirubrobacterales bacterium]|nr:hypothetical protein [Solirubrobacterales bacterium]
ERRIGGPVVQWLYELIAVLTPKIGIRLAVLSVSLLFPLKVLDRPLGMVLGTKELCVAIVAQRPE